MYVLLSAFVAAECVRVLTCPSVRQALLIECVWSCASPMHVPIACSANRLRTYVRWNTGWTYCLRCRTRAFAFNNYMFLNSFRENNAIIMHSNISQLLSIEDNERVVISYSIYFVSKIEYPIITSLYKRNILIHEQWARISVFHSDPRSLWY